MTAYRDAATKRFYRPRKISYRTFFKRFLFCNQFGVCNEGFMQKFNNCIAWIHIVRSSYSEGSEIINKKNVSKICSSVLLQP